MYSYIIPSYTMLLITIVFLILTIFNMRINMDPTITPHDNVNLPSMALKLSFVFGVIEIISIFGGISRSTELSAIIDHTVTMIYSTVRSSRGVLLFVIFFLTKNVLKHVKRVFVNENERNNAQVSTSATQSSRL